MMSLAVLTGLVLAVAQSESSSAPLAVQYAGQGRVERLQKLLEADPKAVAVTEQGGRTPLHAAAAGGHVKTVALLLEKKAPPDARDRDGSAPLQLAAAGGHLQVVELLLTAGANASGKNREGLTAADLAERGGHRAVKSRLDEARPLKT
jgi:ankyrin repeat protein